MSTTIENMLVKLGADTGEFEQKMGFADKTMNSLGSVAKGVAVGVGVLATAVTGVAIASGKMAADFQADMQNVQSLLGKGATEKVKAYGQEVKRVSKETGKELSDMSDGIYQVISAWGDTPDTVKLLEISAKASAAGLATTTDAVNLLSAHTKGYGDISAEATQKAADLAFVTVNLGQTTFPELAATMGKVIPLAATLKVKEEELYGAMATLTGVTGNTAEVTTQLRATMQALLNPSKDMNKAMSELGFENGNAMIQTLGLKGTLDALGTTTGGNTQQLAKMYGSVEALNAVLALTGNQSVDFASKTEAMSKANGAATEAFEIQQQSVNAMMDRLKAMGTVAMVTLGEKFLPMLEKVGKWVMDHMPEIETAFDMAFALIDQGFKLIGQGIDWFLMNIWQPLVKVWAENSDEIGGKMAETGAWLAETWDKISGIFSKVIEIVGLVWTEWGDEIMTVATIAWNTISTLITAALDIIGGVLDVFIGLFTGDWKRMGDGLLSIWDGVWAGVGAIISGAWNLIVNSLTTLNNSFSKWFDSLIADAIGWGASVMQGFLNGMIGMFGNIAKRVTDFIDSMVSKVKGVLDINSPSGVFEEIGANISKGLAVGIEDGNMTVQHAINSTLPSAPRTAGFGGGSGGGGGMQTPIFIQLGSSIIADLVVEGAVTAVRTGRLNPVVLGG